MSFPSRFLTITEAAEIVRLQARSMFEHDPNVVQVIRRDLDTMLETDFEVKLDRGGSSEAVLSIRLTTDRSAEFKKIPLLGFAKSRGKYKVVSVESEINAAATRRTPGQAQVFSEVLADLAKLGRTVESLLGRTTILLPQESTSGDGPAIPLRFNEDERAGEGI